METGCGKTSGRCRVQHFRQRRACRCPNMSFDMTQSCWDDRVMDCNPNDSRPDFPVCGLSSQSMLVKGCARKGLAHLSNLSYLVNVTTSSAGGIRLGSLRGRRDGGVWTRVRVVIWFRRGSNPWGDPCGALASQLDGQVRDQRLAAYSLS